MMYADDTLFSLKDAVRQFNVTSFPGDLMLSSEGQLGR